MSDESHIEVSAIKPGTEIKNFMTCFEYYTWVMIIYYLHCNLNYKHFEFILT